MPKTPGLPDLEGSLTEINTIIEQMERGDLTLEKSLSHFENGIRLIKHAQKILQTAEQKVQVWMKSSTEGRLTDFDEGEKE